MSRLVLISHLVTIGLIALYVVLGFFVYIPTLKDYLTITPLSFVFLPLGILIGGLELTLIPFLEPQKDFILNAIFFLTGLAILAVEYICFFGISYVMTNKIRGRLTTHT